MKDKRIVVTGGAGFIGSNIARELTNDNQIIVLDDLSTGSLNNIQDLIDSQQIEFIEGSITDLDFLQKTFDNVDYVFHEAAIPSVPRSVKDPITSNYVNGNGTLNVLIAARDNHIKKVVYASSSSVYGDTPILPKKEEMTPHPLSPYAISKLTGEYYCEVFNNIYDLSTISLRYFNVFGPHQDPQSEYAAVIPRFINKVLHFQSPTIYGDGTQTRDFTFVKDVVHANIQSAVSNSTGVFNIAGGKLITVNDLANTIMDLCGNKVKLIYDDPREGDIKHSLADISKAIENLHYHQKYDIHGGLMETIKWLQK